ncbi:N-acetyl-1-D-myo-inositol-2-amino-2-deoxy-alpha-D-glucopyranoside deacetylase [Frankia sp. AgKG'84/4]|uniref:N-acetyl-1-D-myo-inositol-2-amino-2-deoxy-alpha- D-glucopyranoside deacetylase n=1 Tax=Frankia sp. AgKG'84/4 TaxID=573490 RepID=UPI00200CB86F|nr:N-acetyl-1-D-myo-inositol-2-amino-2-deoxy-alpha-D-glucopyranoside deacetylase [Frankia sp. AgKG'84/4]MCL9794917.1 N-acetyl-1-D-myo-inositol-2-amino-2-deoxy-alpha-D-glucopyranoside deacetylase [Frankia sp. AgKG'84/4]
MFVHAHPDDEVISTGVAIASYAAAPDTSVTLVTCTLGEEGEVLVPELENLRAELGDQLGGYRIGELAGSCAALGVTDHRFLGGPGRFRDSGMMGTPANDHPRALWRADLDEATAELVRIVRDVRPHVLVSYDSFGGYGHPDHIRAHDLTARAFTDAADPAFGPDTGAPWQVSKRYETALARAWALEGFEHFRGSDAPNNPFAGLDSLDDFPVRLTDDATLTTEIVAPEYVDAKIAAMRAHRTQMAVDGFFFALADGIGQRAWGAEHFVLAAGTRGPGAGTDGRETDFFAGVRL